MPGDLTATPTDLAVAMVDSDLASADLAQPAAILDLSNADLTPLATCSNKVKDNDETDVDCGGSCPGCPSTRNCKGGNDCLSHSCVTGFCTACPSDMVQATSVTGVHYCIDKVERTNAQYAAFLASSPSTDLLPLECRPHSTFDPVPPSDTRCLTPPVDLTGVRAIVYDPVGRANYPIVCIDWCDAKSYCKWAGRYLCRGMDGNTVPLNGISDPLKSQWHNACSAQGARPYPYGQNAVDKVCNAIISGGAMAPVGTFPGCEGGVAGLLDMVGNVSEWEDDCLKGQSGNHACFARGGSWAMGSTCGDRYDIDFSIDAPYSKLQAARPELGFRCCGDSY